MGRSSAGLSLEHQRRARVIRESHSCGRPLVMPNPWEAGTARLAGFQALGTTRAGLATTQGKRDRAASVTLGETISNAKSIVDSTGLSVSGDLEGGFGPTLDDVAAAIACAASVGLVDGLVGDIGGEDPGCPIHPFNEAVGRVKAAVRTPRSLPTPFTVTARAESFLHGLQDLQDAIRRVCAHEDMGAFMQAANRLKVEETCGFADGAVGYFDLGMLFAGGEKQK